MNPKTITLDDDVFEQVKQRAEAEGKTVEESRERSRAPGPQRGPLAEAREARPDLQPRYGRSPD